MAENKGVKVCGSLSLDVCFYFNMEPRLRSSEALSAGSQPGLAKAGGVLLISTTPPNSLGFFEKVDGVLESPRIFA